MNTNEILFDRKITLKAGERQLCLRCARKAMVRLRRNRCLDGLFAPIRNYHLMWCLSSYALFLREVASGRKIRYRKLTEIAVAGASVMGDREILRVLLRSGVDVSSVRWSKKNLTPFTLAVIGGAEELAMELLAKHPETLDKDNIESNLKACVCHGSETFVECLLGFIKEKFTQGEGRWIDLLSTALFSAVAYDRRGTIPLIMRWGADGMRAFTDGCFPAHCESSLFSCAVDNKNFEFADICLARGWIPAENDVWELPNTANALEDLEKFEYLCKAFPEEGFAADILDYWSKHYQVSQEVFASCGGIGRPRQMDASFAIDECTDDEILADFELLRKAVQRNPDRLFDFVQMDLQRVQKFFATPQAYEWHFFPPYLFRKAKSLGVDLFISKDAERKFVEAIPEWQADEYRPHLGELGWGDYRLKTRTASSAREASDDRQCYERAAKARGKALERFLDDPTFDPNTVPYDNWSFAQSVRCWGTPRTFRAWALRGMDTYGQNCEGNYAIDGAPMPKWRSLVTVFGMSPMHEAYDGSSALGCAIANHEDETAKWLWLHGDHEEWQGSSPLRMSLLNWNDHLARWFQEQGVKNIDSDGREYPIPSWV